MIKIKRKKKIVKKMRKKIIIKKRRSSIRIYTINFITLN